MITAFVNGVEYPPIERKFIKASLELVNDNVTLDNSLYTDSSGDVYNMWSWQYESLTQAEYDAIRADYDLQRTSNQYALLTIPFYSITDVPARMTINDQDIWDNCGSIEGVQITFRETAQLPVVS